MRFLVVAVGRPRNAALAAAIAEYERRATRYWPLSFVEVREGAGGARQPADVRKREGQALLHAAGESVLVLCDERGEAMTSRDFAKAMQRWREDGRDIAFVIGGAHGIADDLRGRTSKAIALAPWTLPHELARLVLAEQLYRAGTLHRGEPYHK